MAYDYAARTVWLDDVSDAAPGGGYALCEVHANRVSAPVTWTLTDHRLLAPPLPFSGPV